MVYYKRITPKKYTVNKDAFLELYFPVVSVIIEMSVDGRDRMNQGGRGNPAIGKMGIFRHFRMQ